MRVKSAESIFCRLLISISGIVLTLPVQAANDGSTDQPVNERIAAIERGVGGRLGVSVLDTGNGKGIEYRAAERFPMCSTFKFLAAAAVLQKVDKNEDRLDRQVSYATADLLEWAPVTKEHVQEGSMALGALCAAAIDYSDNTAANLILQSIGGPSGFTGFVRSLGDRVTRLDRFEPAMSEALKGDERDTTSADAMVNNLRILLLGDKLSTESRRQLEEWLAANKVSLKRLRAGLPSSWRVGDKTGTGQNGATGDVAIVRPPNRAPILIAVYAVDSTASSDELNGAFAALAKIITETL